MSAAPLDSFAQRGSATETFITVVAVAVVGLVVAAAFAGVSQNNEFRRECEKAGGTPLITRAGDKVCLAASNVIPLKR
jgi:hypothetical protein